MELFAVLWNNPRSVASCLLLPYVCCLLTKCQQTFLFCSEPSLDNASISMLDSKSDESKHSDLNSGLVNFPSKFINQASASSVCLQANVLIRLNISINAQDIIDADR